MENKSNSLKMITFGKAVTRPEAIEAMPVNNLMAMMQNGQWRKPIEAIRREKNPVLQKEMKLNLPYFVYGVLEGGRSEDRVRQVNGIVFDFDHIEDFIQARVKLMDAAPWFRWLFRSPIDGLKLMIPLAGRLQTGANTRKYGVGCARKSRRRAEWRRITLRI